MDRRDFDFPVSIFGRVTGSWLAAPCVPCQHGHPMGRKLMLLRSCLFAFLLLPGAALANDTMAELKTGGLSYVQTLDVEMVKEDLFISREEVRVDYIFRNTTGKPVSGIVAFPMPDITGSRKAISPWATYRPTIPRIFGGAGRRTGQGGIAAAGDRQQSRCHR
jgi:hypothetical protein